MSQPGETINFKASDHLKAIQRHCPCPVVDVCVVNTGRIRGKLLASYQQRAARVVENDLDNIRKLGVEVHEADLVRLLGVRSVAKIRHDSGSIGAVAIELAQRAQRRKS